MTLNESIAESMAGAYFGVNLPEQVHWILELLIWSANTAVKRKEKKSHHALPPTTQFIAQYHLCFSHCSHTMTHIPCEWFLQDDSGKLYCNATYLKSNLDLSNFTCTSLLSSTMNSTNTDSRLSYQIAAAGCLINKGCRQQGESITTSKVSPRFDMIVIDDG